MTQLGPLAVLIEQLQRLPGIGAKGAQRLAFHLLRQPRDEVDALLNAVRDVKEQITYCSVCYNITDADPCYYCTHDGRDRGVICVVEDPPNVTAIEKTNDFNGVYHVLMGAAVPAPGGRSGRSEDQEPAPACWRRRDQRSHPRDEPQRRRRGNGHLSRQAAQAVRHPCDAYRHGAARRERPGVRRRGDGAQGDGRPP